MLPSAAWGFEMLAGSASARERGSASWQRRGSTRREERERNKVGDEAAEHSKVMQLRWH